MKKIESRSNPTIKALVALHNAAGRKKAEQFIAEGIRVCQTLLDAGAQLVQCYATAATIDEVSTFIHERDITIVPAPVMRKMSTSVTPSGVLCVFKMLSKEPTHGLKAGLVLANITDPGNVGTMIRTAVAFGIPNVVLLEGVDLYNPKVVQASAGTLASIPVYTMTLQDLIKHKKNLTLAALVIEGGKAPSDIASGKTLLVVGNEAHGIPERVLEQCEERVTIAMPGTAESLNAAIAAGIALYNGWVV